MLCYVRYAHQRGQRQYFENIEASSTSSKKNNSKLSNAAIDSPVSQLLDVASCPPRQSEDSHSEELNCALLQVPSSITQVLRPEQTVGSLKQND